MSLSQALATAVSGLRVTQAGLSVVSANVANAETPGYVRKTLNQVAIAAGDVAISVRMADVNRELDRYVQRQLRVETSGAAFADLRAQFYDRLQNIYGVPGSDTALETVFNNFTAALQGLSTSPDSPSARSAALSTAQVVAQQLNSMTADIQGMRSDAELGLSDSVTQANEAMQQIAEINQQLGSVSSNDATTASLLDQRDQYIAQLARLMDINVVPTDHNRVTIFTTSGTQLVGTQAARLSFDAQGSMTPTAKWDPDPDKRTVGTITLIGPNGDGVDLVANKTFRSGQIAAYLDMRDEVLVQAQAQLDELAAGMARALSDKTTDGTAVPGGFDIDLNGLLAGNTVRVTYTVNATGQQRTVTIMRVDDPAALPLQDSVTTDPNDRVIGIDFSGGLPSIISQLATGLAATSLQFSTPGGTTLRILDDGGANKIDVNAVSSTRTVTSLTGGSAELPFFVDANTPYTGAISAIGPQSVGLAGRIAVNAALMTDSSRLVVYQTSPLTPAGDSTRPNFIYDRLNASFLSFSPASGIGTESTPFTGTLPAFLRQVISQQGDAASSAGALKQGQDVVLNSLQQRFNSAAAVNIDQEMANLLLLQNSYAANARVLSTIKDMIETLFNM